MATEDLKHWSSFWDQGYITTFGDSKPRNYDGVVRQFWEEKFVELPAGARILDIAAGNGAIATIAAQVGLAKGKDFFVAASDIADVHAEIVGDDDTKNARKSIEFHSRTPCEQQPFEDDYFNMVTSQFGFEYSDIEKTLAEIRRVLIPGGKFVAICHHTESVLIKTADVERGIYSTALEDLDLFGASRLLYETIGDFPSDPKVLKKLLKKTRSLSDSVNEKLEEFRRQHGGDERTDYIIGAITYIAQTAQQTTLEQRLAAVEQARTDCLLHRARLDDMVNASLDQAGSESLAVMANEAGFESVNCLRIFGDDNALAGWQVHLG